MQPNSAEPTKTKKAALAPAVNLQNPLRSNKTKNPYTGKDAAEGGIDESNRRQ